ncbi:ATP-binding protein [Parafrankia sp. FMc2]|uniref:ATP-binding protein n=1 Tax=Parafrankia sp. FMc2 TaxID=3233196 RepID=UPI0034D4711F
MSTLAPGAVPGGGIVGRYRELDALRAWLDAARDGAGRLVLCVGEPGIGKTRLAQELAGVALAGGTTVAWGRCVEAEGAPAFWPWRQVLRSLGADPDVVLGGDVESPEDRFRVFDAVAEAVRGVADTNSVAVILDDIHWGDEPSLLVLRHLADRTAGARLLVFTAFRDVGPAGVLRRVLPDLLRSPAVERLELRGFGLDEVREQLSRTAVGESVVGARAVLDLTGGNPLFVREVARAIADGTWQPDRPPRTVLDAVAARLDRVSVDCRRLVQAAGIVGRDFSLVLVAGALDEPVAWCLPPVDEAIAYGLLDRVGDTGNYRFVHALTRDAVEASLTTADRAALHRAVAEAIEARFAGDLSDHLPDIARHWASLAPYGEAVTARAWAIRAAADAVRRLAYEQGVRLYQAALALDASSLPDVERCRLLVALGRAAYFAGDLRGCVNAAVEAAGAARAAQSPELAGEAALVLEAAPTSGVNAVAEQLCEQALADLGDNDHEGLRARLLAQRSHLAFYDGDQDRVASLSVAALELARASCDDHALADALRARQEALPGPAGRAERLLLATEMLALARRTNGARAAMWGELWRIDALIESGQLAAAAEELPALRVAVSRVGGPVSVWHLDRVTACVAQAQGRYATAAAAGRRGYDRMRVVEPAPATGAFAALQCALAHHIGVNDEVTALARRPFDPPPRFTTMAWLSRAFLLLCAGLPDEAMASYQQAGPLEMWSLPAFFVLPGYVYGALAAARLGRHDDLTVLLDRLEQFRGEHATGNGVAYMGPTELTLGRGAAVLGRLDLAVEDLAVAADQADRAGAPGYVAEARYHLAATLLTRDSPGDHDRATAAARDADRLARALGMAAYTDRTAALLAQLDNKGRLAVPLSPRETQVAGLVAEGLTNRQIATRLVLSERTAQNHVQHILTKLGFTTRSQIAAWHVHAQLSRPMSHSADAQTVADS